LEEAIRHHLNVYESARHCNPVAAGVNADLTSHLGPIEPVLELLDRRLRHPVELNRIEFSDLVSFVRDALLDERARKENLCTLVPPAVTGAHPDFVQQLTRVDLLVLVSNSKHPRPFRLPSSRMQHVFT